MSEKTPAGPKGTLLLVEDDADLREVLGEILSAVGYRVLSAGDAAEALALSREAGGVDIVLSDIIMPGTNGIDLAVEIRKEFPGARILLMSGSLDQDIVNRVIAEGLAMLRKPFTPTTLKAALQRINTVGAPTPEPTL